MLPGSAFWFLQGMLASLLGIAILFARREDIVVDALRGPGGVADSASEAVAAEERAVELMHVVHRLLWPRLKQLEASGVGTDFWFRSTYSHLMAPTGHCGSFAQVFARVLQRDGYQVRIGQMLVDGVWAGHVIVLARVGDRWLALDPYFDVAFRGNDGRLMQADEIRDRWQAVRSQCPPGYEPSYRYESMRFTNWRGVPIDLLGAVFGGLSLRTHFLNLYWVVAALSGSAMAILWAWWHHAIRRAAKPA
jgi:hypothetical protein